MLFRRIPVAFGVAGLLALPAAQTFLTAAPAWADTPTVPAVAPAAVAPVAVAPAAVAPAADPAAVSALAEPAAVASGPDAEFLQAAHQANLAEIAAGRIAWTKSSNPGIKSLAASFMRDHIRMDAELYQTARKLRVFLPGTPTVEQQALAERYTIAGPDTFDEYFISTQLAAHRAALKLTGEESDKGSAAPVKALAENATPIIARHRQMLRDAAEALGMAGYVDAGGRRG
ncbi:DUF4142 domain-containing protein [Actinoplanes sp. HUAS TT8]|uniref:DUF4142 domain-containing protein n=1 Tax=Actinoplanes sp. HUAS TT8 TaxID=3447453 RepID=UPI003F52741C